MRWIIALAMMVVAQGTSPASQPHVTIVRHDAQQRVDVLVDGKPFTSYIYSAKVKKPVLFPLRTATGTIVTRGFPLEPRSGERADHPHQVGAWFTYGDVNGIDFWGYSDDTPANEVAQKGTIVHRAITRTADGAGQAELAVTADWVMPDGSTILAEETRFIFRATADSRAIDRVTRWTARDRRVVFGDTKEGAFGIRVARGLEQPSNEPEVFTDGSGHRTTVPKLDNAGVTGQYRSSEGKVGDDVWGTRAPWVMLTGTVDREPVTLAILDHPTNPGYPTYWHARGYGLFAANPLGQAAFTDGKQRMALTLEPGRSVVFQHRILILSGNASPERVQSEYQQFAQADSRERHLLYVAVPGVRNYVEHGGVGVLVFDVDDGHRFLKRIPTFETTDGEPPEAIKGIAASAQTGRLYVTTTKRLAAIDLRTERVLWNREYDGGCDRLAISPDGSLLYVPSLEGPHWNIIDAASGDVVAKVVTNSGAHNTIYGSDGAFVYLAGLKSPMLNVAETRTHTIAKRIGPFGNVIRPFTINREQTLCFVNVNDLLGFEVGDLRTGKMLHRVVVEGFEVGPVKRHGCPSHGIALTPDETELWLADAANSSVHVFDVRSMPPKQVTTVRLRDQPGWVTFSIDGKYAYPSTGDVVDTKSRAIVAELTDEAHRAVQSEKLLEIVFGGDRPTSAGDQFGVGRGE